jgi:F0F1-type ATP synthase membrane subunit c/vacuolar-type H+-ATPase subunit K
MSGIIAVYGLVVSVLIAGSSPSFYNRRVSLAYTLSPVKPAEYPPFAGYVHLGAGLACGITGMGAGWAVGLVGDSVGSAFCASSNANFVAIVVRQSLCARTKGFCHYGSRPHFCRGARLIRVRTGLLLVDESPIFNSRLIIALIMDARTKSVTC